MKRKATILFFLAFNLHQLITQAQLPDYHVQLFDERNGLDTDLMYKVLKDRDGFLWILYRYKFHRFDGKTVKEFEFEEPMYSISCDDQNNIWAASRSHFYKYVDKKKKFVKIPHDTTGNPILGQFLKIPGYATIAHSSKGFYILDNASGTFKKIVSGPLAVPKKLDVLSADVFGARVFVYGNDTMYSIDVKSGDVRKLPGATDVNGVHALNEDTILLSGFNNYSYWFDFKNSAVTKIDIGRGLGGPSSYFLRSYGVQQLNAAEYFVSSIHGLLLYNSQTKSFKKQQLYLEGKPLAHEELISDFMVDDQKNVWAVYGYGLIYFRAVEDQIGLVRNADIDAKHSWDNNVRGFAEDERGNLWMATLNGFAYYDLENGKITPYQPDVNDSNTYSFPSIRGIATDNEYVVLGPTNRGLWLYHIKTKTFHRPLFQQNDTGKQLKDKLYNDFIDHILKLKSGDYIISARDGFYHMKGKTFLVKEIHFPGETENGNFAYKDNNDQIWLVTQTRLYCFDPDLRYLFRAFDDPGNNIACMLQLKSGEYLIGGRRIYLMKKRTNSIDTSMLDPYFNGKRIAVLFQDTQNKIWIGTTEGLVRYDMKTRKAEPFNFFDNVQGSYFNPRAFHLARSGILFLGGSKGINYLVPHKVRSRTDSLKVTIVRFTVNNNEMSVYGDPGFRLKHFQNSIDIEFTAPYFRNANHVRYRYQLKGFDEQWIDNGHSNTIRFTALPPGNYQFKVAASVDSDHWFETNIPVSFLIRLPFWKTWWFISLVFATIALAVYALYKYQLNKRLEVERLRLRISRDLHDDIGSTLSSINILARSSLAKAPEDNSNSLLLEKIQQRSQKTLDAMDDLIWNTRPENDSLESLIVRMREYAAEILEAAGIEFTLNCPAAITSIKLDMQQKRNLFLIFKEAINNLAKYSDTRNAFIHFDYQKKFLQMIIIDEGKGFALTSIKKGNGLDNMQHRAAEMNAQFDIHSANGKGTTIRVHVPV